MNDRKETLPDDARRILQDLLAASGVEATKETWAALEKPKDVLSHSEVDLIHEITYSGIFRGFFALAAEGYEFVPERRVQEKFGKSLSENYPEASGEFLRFARSYWTLKVWLGDTVRPGLGVGVGQLQVLEREVGTYFFPTPGPAKVDPVKREAVQRNLLAEHKVTFDIDSFMAGNPILLRDQRQANSGCLVALITLGIAG